MKQTIELCRGCNTLLGEPYIIGDDSIRPPTVGLMRESALYIMQLIERVIVSDDPKAKVAEIIADLQPSLPADLLDRYRKAPTEPPTPQDAAWLLEEWHKWS